MASLRAGETFIDLDPAGYQYATAENDWDANWLNVKVEAGDGTHAISVTEPAFLTWEFDELVRWIRGALDGKAIAGFSGMEPVIQAEYDRDDPSAGITFVLTQKARPATLDKKIGEWRLEFRLQRGEFERFAEELAGSLSSFPIRVVEEHGYARRLIEEEQ